jgi:cysteine-rich repeat protein
VSGAPVVTGFQPGSGMPGARITVIGRNLGRATAVTFDRMPTSDLQSDAAGTAIEVTIPLGATSGPIAVTAPGGTASTGALVPPRLFIVTRGSACGDGRVDAGEACDDGNLAPGDCCDARCRIVATGTPCDDGVFCDGADACDAGTCGLHAGDPCAGATECLNTCDEAARHCLSPADTPCGDDGDPCSDDACDGAGACTHPVRPRRACKAPVHGGASRLEVIQRA